MTGAERDQMNALFAERIFPVLTPLAVDPSHPFPYISGLSINLAVLVRSRDRCPAVRTGQGAHRAAPVPAAPGRFVPLEDVIARHLDRLFSGMQIVQHHTFG
jgi:polyphosphate kinase